MNSFSERRDPPQRLMVEAIEAGCQFVIDSDAHAPGALGEKIRGCERASTAGITAGRLVNTLPADGLIEWARSHDHAAARPARHV